MLCRLKMMKIMNKIRLQITNFLNKICWLCVAKAGLALGIASIFLAHRNLYVPLGAVIFNIPALFNSSREHDQSNRGMIKVLASIGLTLGILFGILGLFR